MSDLSKMCHTIITSLFKKTTCEMYPVKPARFYKISRGSVQLDTSKCTLCTLCEKRCPTGAIKVDRNGATWEIDRTKCIICDECVSCCRPKALTMDNQYTAPSFDKVIDTINVPKKEKPAPKKTPPKKVEKKTTVKKKAEDKSVVKKTTPKKTSTKTTEDKK